MAGYGGAAVVCLPLRALRPALDCFPYFVRFRVGPA